MYFSRWNPHMLVSPLLVERFNRDQDLSKLINCLKYSNIDFGSLARQLPGEHAPLAGHHLQLCAHPNALHQGGRPSAGHRGHIPSGIDGNINCQQLFSTIYGHFQSNLIPVDEHVIRLCYGQIAMEFMLLNDNQVAVRDSTVGGWQFSRGIFAFLSRHITSFDQFPLFSLRHFGLLLGPNFGRLLARLSSAATTSTWK